MALVPWHKDKDAKEWYYYDSDDLNDEDKMHKDLCSFLGMSYATTINKNISSNRNWSNFWYNHFWNIKLFFCIYYGVRCI